MIEAIEVTDDLSINFAIIFWFLLMHNFELKYLCYKNEILIYIKKIQNIFFRKAKNA